MEETEAELVRLASAIVAAYVGNNSIAPADLPGLIATAHGALAGVGKPKTDAASTPVKLTPGQIRKSITPDAIISFEDGKGYKTLKRHLTLRGLTAAAYKAKWGLPHDYPTTAPSYSAQRSAMAKSIGLGQMRAPAAAQASAKPKAAAKAATPAPARARKRAAPKA